MAKRGKQRAAVPASINHRSPANTTPQLYVDFQIPSKGSEKQGEETVLHKEEMQLAKRLEEVAKMENSAKKADQAEGSKTKEAVNQSKPATSKVWADFDISKLRNYGAKLEYVKPQMVGETMMGKLEDEDVEPEIEYWKNAIVCYVLGANPPFQVMNGFLRRIWGKHGIDKILMLPNGILLVRFNTFEEKNEILKDGVVHFDSRPVIIKDYAIDADWSKKEVKTVPIWIRMPGLPLKYWNAKALGKITSPLGVPVMVDPLTLKKDRIGFARVLLDVVIQEELPEKCYFLNNKDQVIEQKIEYEWRPTLCSGCKGYGHLVANCKKGNKETRSEYKVKQVQEEGKLKDKGKWKVIEGKEEAAAPKLGGVEELRTKDSRKEEGSSSSNQNSVLKNRQKPNTAMTGRGSMLIDGSQAGSGNRGQQFKQNDHG